MKTKIENFSIEIFLEIFEYLDIFDILTAFSDLNNRIQKLLHSPSLQFKIRYSYSESVDIFIQNWNQFIADYSHQIYSLDLYYRAEFVSSLNIDSSFIRLRSLKLISTYAYVVVPLLENLHKLPCLQSLNVHLGEFLPDLIEFYEIIFTLSTLKSCQISNEDDDGENSKVFLPLANQTQFSPIEFMHISHRCTFDELEIIVSYMPKLHSLSILHMNDYFSLSPLDLANLTSLKIELYELQLNELKVFLRIIQSQLKDLHIVDHTEDLDYINAQRWEDYLSENFPHLKRFSLSNFIEFIDDEDFPFGAFKTSQFTSSFWIKRQLVLDITFENGLFIQQIGQYRKRWYDDQTDISQSAQFIIQGLITMDDPDILPFYIQHALQIVEYYYLEIVDQSFLNSILLQVLDLLPELQSLKIHSLSFNHSKELTEDERDILFMLGDICEITNIYLESMIEITDIYFLMVICPYLKYLKIGSINQMNEENFLRAILLKVRFEKNQYFRLLSFQITGVDDQLIEKLETMIDSEKLVIDYKLKHVGEEIYLELK